ncbi:MAG: hypothetical protein LBE75_08920 [Burkholderiales bacterium]|jgi:hypothetical protein|nr:hypothetical protein [Burkholderiales bacterium]
MIEYIEQHPTLMATLIGIGVILVATPSAISAMLKIKPTIDENKDVIRKNLYFFIALFFTLGPLILAIFIPSSSSIRLIILLIPIASAFVYFSVFRTAEPVSGVELTLVILLVLVFNASSVSWLLSQTVYLKKELIAKEALLLNEINYIKDAQNLWPTDPDARVTKK